MPITANAQGQLSGRFQIPASVPAGSKLIEFQGSATNAFATFVGRGTLKIDELRTVTTQVNRRLLTWRGDPLAQTFTMPERQQVAAVDLWFTAIGSTNVLVQIRDAAMGLPTLDVVAESILTPAEISLDGWTRFRFPPTVLEADREYALVVACNDAVSAVGVAGLGEFDAGTQAWVTSQPYQIGVLLSSSNNRTWTPHQTKDLTFRLLACDYDVETNVVEEGQTQKTIVLDPVTVTDADHLVVMAAVDRPTPECDVVFAVTVDGVVYTVAESQPWTLPARYSGQITWSAILTGTFVDSPVLYPDLCLVAGKRQASSDYISRAMQTNIGDGPDVKVTAYYDAFLPGASSVDAFVENGSGVWLALPIIDGTELGDGWVEVKREVEEFDQTETRVKLVLNGSALALPRIRNLRVAIT
jgi:hypothetical protein